MRRWRGTSLAAVLVLLGWLGLLAYVWIWTRRHWGVGWALVGSINVTLTALLALVVIWVVGWAGGRLGRRFGRRR
ncbi:MAG TPA: hypothetical protein VFU30_11975 [Gaiellaceae bacterium]|nr:hypothetical protein [Gaiellaceae bacterium]